MQAYKPLQGIKHYSKVYKKEKMYYKKFKVFTNSKNKVLIKNRSKNEAYIY